MKTATIKLTSGIGIRGTMFKAGSILEVPEEAAKDLLRRGKAELATEADEAEPEAEDDAAEEAAPKKAKK